MTRPRTMALIVSIIATLATAGLRSQQPEALSGTVTVEDNGLRIPVRRAAVTLTNDAAKTSVTVFTDADGRFGFRSIAAGHYRLGAVKAGFLQLRPVAITEADATVSVEMQRAAALEGRFVQDTGKPIPGLTVYGERVAASSDDQASIAARTFSAKTDDLGRFRIHTIPSGKYRVFATPPPPASAEKHFYPGTETPENAGIVTVVSGQTLDGLLVVVPTGPLSAIAAEALATQELESMSAPSAGGTWGQIAGRVTQSDSGQPVVNVVVGLSTAAGAYLRKAWTDGDGRYSFTRVMAGNYLLSASADGYIGISATLDRPAGTAPRIALGDGEKLRKDLELTPFSAIEGRIVDDYGDGASSVMVQIAQKITGPDGQIHFVPVRNMPGIGPTDDRGWFRAPGLIPGDYYLVALPQPFAPSATVPFPVTFFPGTTSSSAAGVIRLAAGVDAPGVNLALPTAHATTLTGTAIDSNGSVQNATVDLMPVEDGEIRVAARATSTSVSGKFSFQNVPEGSYVLQARGRSAFTSSFVTVTADAGPETPVQVVLRPLSTVSGRVTFEGGEPPMERLRSLMALRIQPTSFSLGPAGGVTESGGLRGTILADLTFSIRNVAWPGLIRLEGDGGLGWSLLHVFHAGRDIIDTPYDFPAGGVAGVEVVLTRRTGGLSGTIVGADTLESVMVLIEGADGESTPYLERTRRLSVPNKDGRFVVPGLLPGRYFAVAFRRKSSPTTAVWLTELRPLSTLVVVPEGISTPVQLTVVK